MSLSTISIKRPVFTIVINLLIILFGIIGYSYLGVREFPSIDPAQISVRTNYTGANADIIESQITEPLEKAINSIDGIRNITSSSNQGSSNITIEFKLEKNLEEAANDVRDKVSQAIRSLPQDIDAPPVVSKADADSDAIISMTVQSDTKSVLELSDYAENVIAERLQTIPGVSGVQIWGQKRYAMRIWLDPVKLNSYGVTVSDVRIALEKQNVELPSGKLTGANTELTVKTLGNLSNETEFNNIIIVANNDKIVRLSDVGRAELGPENLETQFKANDQSMVALAIVPQPGTNYLAIAEEFYKQYEGFQKDLPKDIKLNVALDNTVFIKKSIVEVAETLLISVILVILIIFLFFRDWSIAFRPLIDIPVSLIGAFFIMLFFIAVIFKLYRLILFGFSLVAAFVIFVVFFASEDFYYFVIDTLTFQNASSVGHVLEWVTALESMIQNPLGVGLAMSGNSGSVTDEARIGGENQFLIYGVQLGFLGMILYILLLGFSISRSIRVFRLTENVMTARIAFTAATVKIGLLLPLFTSNAELFAYVTWITWWMVGYAMNEYSKIKNEEA